MGLSSVVPQLRNVVASHLGLPLLHSSVYHTLHQPLMSAILDLVP